MTSARDAGGGARRTRPGPGTTVGDAVLSLFLESCLMEPAERKLTDHLQEAIAAAPCFEPDEVLAHEAVERLSYHAVLFIADGSGGVRGEGAGEGCQPNEHLALVLLEEAFAPLDG